jgi:hypothetical protein
MPPSIDSRILIRIITAMILCPTLKNAMGLYFSETYVVPIKHIVAIGASFARASGDSFSQQVLWCIAHASGDSFSQQVLRRIRNVSLLSSSSHLYNSAGGQFGPAALFIKTS